MIRVYQVSESWKSYPGAIEYNPSATRSKSIVKAQWLRTKYFPVLWKEKFWQCLKDECFEARTQDFHLKTLQNHGDYCYTYYFELLLTNPTQQQTAATDGKCTSLSYLIRFRHLCGQLEHCVSYRFYKPLQTTPAECRSVFSPG